MTTAHSSVPLILSEAAIHRFRFGGRSRPRGGVTLVMRTADGRLRAVDGQLTASESVFGPSATQYEVDVADHLTVVELPVRTRDDAYAFTVAVDVTWRVADPAEVVRRRVADGAALVVVALRDRLKEMGRRFGITQTVEFEQEIRNWFLSGEGHVIDGCLAVQRISPEVGLDAAGAERLAKLRAAEGHTAVLHAEHQNKRLEQQQADEIAEIAKAHELRRRQMEYEQNMAAKQAEERFAQEQRDRQAQREEMTRRAEREWTAQFERQEQQWRDEAERRRKELETELTRQQLEWQSTYDRQQQELETQARWAEQRRQRELEKERSQDFINAIERGDAGFLAIYLGQHPEAAGKIIDLIMRRAEVGEERQAKLLADLFNRNLINEADLEGSRDSLVSAFLGMVTRPASGLFKVNTTVEVESVVAGKESAAIDAGSDDD